MQSPYLRNRLPNFWSVIDSLYILSFSSNCYRFQIFLYPIVLDLFTTSIFLFFLCYLPTLSPSLFLLFAAVPFCATFPALPPSLHSLLLSTTFAIWISLTYTHTYTHTQKKIKKKKESLKMSLCPALSNINICLYTTFTCHPIACSFLFMHSCL